MRTMTLGMMIGLVAMAVVPHFASASTCDPTFTACVGEGSYNYGSCSSGYGFNYGYDYAEAFTPAGYIFAEGFGENFCYGSYSFDYSGVSAGGCDFVMYNCAYAAWYGGSDNQGFSYCDSYVYSGATGFQDIGCPAGAPPNPGWGTLGLP